MDKKKFSKGITKNKRNTVFSWNTPELYKNAPNTLACFDSHNIPLFIRTVHEMHLTVNGVSLPLVEFYYFALNCVMTPFTYLPFDRNSKKKISYSSISLSSPLFFKLQPTRNPLILGRSVGSHIFLFLSPRRRRPISGRRQWSGGSLKSDADGGRLGFAEGGRFPVAALGRLSILRWRGSFAAVCWLGGGCWWLRQ